MVARSRSDDGIEVRIATAADRGFLARMLVEAACPPWHEPRPTPAEAMADPRAGAYLRGWGRPGDAGVIALERGWRRIGAAWYRRLSASDVETDAADVRTPRVAIAVSRHRRGHGIGTRLLSRLLAFARESGVSALALDVSERNPGAIALYRAAGFEVVGERGGQLRMLWSDSRTSALGDPARSVS